MSLNWKRYALIGVVLLALAGAGWFLIGRLFPSNPPGPTPSERTSDSLAITKPIDQGKLDSSNAHIVARQPASDAAVKAARIAQERADRAKHRADSLAADSAWEAAYRARTVEADSLRSVTVSDATIITNLKADTVDLRFQLSVVNKRLVTTEAVNAGLRKDLEQARECKILGYLNCLSRVQTAALTLLVTAGAEAYRSR